MQQAAYLLDSLLSRPDSGTPRLTSEGSSVIHFKDAILPANEDEDELTDLPSKLQVLPSSGGPQTGDLLLIVEARHSLATPSQQGQVGFPTAPFQIGLHGGWCHSPPFPK